jgi:hypothetical protein
MCGPGRRGLGALGDGPGPGRPVLRQSLPTCHFENGTVINVAPDGHRARHGDDRQCNDAVADAWRLLCRNAGADINAQCAHL